jgi:hypothetical protein
LYSKFYNIIVKEVSILTYNEKSSIRSPQQS